MLSVKPQVQHPLWYNCPETMLIEYFHDNGQRPNNINVNIEVIKKNIMSDLFLRPALNIYYYWYEKSVKIMSLENVELNVNLLKILYARALIS